MLTGPEDAANVAGSPRASRRWHRCRLLAAAVPSLAAHPGAVGSPAAPRPPSASTGARAVGRHRQSPILDRRPVTACRADIDALLDARDTVHPDGWHGMPRADWIAAADAVKAKAATLSPRPGPRRARPPRGDAELERARRPQRDLPVTAGSGIHPYPLRWWRFSDGLVITAARAPYEDLVGSRVEAIDGRPIDEVIASSSRWPRATTRRTCSPTAAIYCRRRASSWPASASSTQPGRRHSRSSVATATPGDVTIDPITVEDDVAWHSGQPHRLPPTRRAVAQATRTRPCGGRTWPTRARSSSSTTRSSAGSSADRRRDPRPGEGARRRAGRRRSPPQRRRRQHHDGRARRRHCVIRRSTGPAGCT